MFQLTLSNCHTRNGLSAVDANCTTTNDQIELFSTIFMSNTNRIGEGGALAISGCSASVERSLFQNNQGVNGGAISVMKGAAVKIVDSVFRKNTAFHYDQFLWGDPNAIFVVSPGFFYDDITGLGGAIFMKVKI